MTLRKHKNIRNLSLKIDNSFIFFNFSYFFCSILNKIKIKFITKTDKIKCFKITVKIGGKKNVIRKIKDKNFTNGIFDDLKLM